jgi:acetyl-CoA carboxylase, biotin carboxylase subunit
VRWDGGIETGSEVTLHYDPMLAKLIVHAPTRELAIERMHRALSELVVTGIETSREFHLRVMEDAEFRAGAIEIQWLERRLASLTQDSGTVDGARLAALAGALLAETDSGARPNAPLQTISDTSGWQRVARLEALG